MKAILVVGAVVTPFLLSGCGAIPRDQGASYGATGETEGGYVTVKDGKRQETLVGTRVARDKTENAEFVKMVSRRGFKEGQDEKPGSPLNGQTSGGF